MIRKQKAKCCTLPILCYLLKICFRYKIENLAYAQQYVMFTEIAVCLEYNGDCEINQTIFDNTILYKTPCDMNIDFVEEGLYFVQNQVCNIGFCIVFF